MASSSSSSPIPPATSMVSSSFGGGGGGSSSSLSPTMTAGAGVASSSSSSSSSSPCAACKFLRRKCQPDCVFAPYFPPDNPQKFIHVHRVFGASNVTKLLNELHPCQREDAVNSLAYEADMRLRDPVYGCVGVISILQHQLRQLQLEISCAKSELSKYQSAFGHPNPFPNPSININSQPSIAAAAAAAGVTGPFFPIPNSRDPPHHQQGMLMMRSSYDSDLAARIGANGAGYDAGFVAAAMNASASSIGTLAGGQFLKPSAAAGDDRHGISPP